MTLHHRGLTADNDLLRYALFGTFAPYKYMLAFEAEDHLVMVQEPV